jgi:hypothetical protein
MYVFTGVNTGCCKNNYFICLNGEMDFGKSSVWRKIGDTKEK